MTGGSGEIRTRDQRIKRSRGSSKPHINQCSKGPENDCAIDCAITSLIFRSNFGLHPGSLYVVNSHLLPRKQG